MYVTPFQDVSQRNKARSGHFHRTYFGQPDRNFGVVGTDGAEIDLERRRVGIDAGGDPQHMVVVGSGDPDRLIVAAGVVEQLHDRFVGHGSTVVGEIPNVRRQRPFSTRARYSPVWLPSTLVTSSGEFPLNGSRLDVAADGDATMSPLAVKVAGGVPPMTVLVNGLPVGELDKTDFRAKFGMFKQF